MVDYKTMFQQNVQGQQPALQELGVQDQSGGMQYPTMPQPETQPIWQDQEKGYGNQDISNEYNPSPQPIMATPPASSPYQNKSGDAGEYGPPSSLNTNSPGGMDALKGVGKTAMNALGELSQAQGNMSANQYNSDMSRWQNQEKYWLDPNSDVKPDIEKYLSMQPSQRDALVDSSWASKASGSTAGQVLLNPMGATGKAGQYIGGEAAEGAISGLAAGGGWGALVGGVIGALKGVWGWVSAGDKDAKAKAQALQDYEASLKAWQIQRAKNGEATNRRILNQDISQKEETNKKQVGAATTRRQQMLSIMQNAASARPEMQYPTIGRN